ncbi:MAG: energy transducer TonB [Acidobacteriota bacterium]|nr:energy transducer TonB [Acidobacteriota bacterium]
MPTSETQATENEPNEPRAAAEQAASVAVAPVAPEDDPSQTEPATGGGSRSRWVDYDTHELLQMISELEDERRWARLREGIWLAILIHVLVLSLVTWIPKYVFKVPPVIDPFDAIKQRKDLSYLDLPPDALRQLQPKVKIKPVPEKAPQIDKKTLEAMNKPTPPPVAEPTPPPAAEPTQPVPPPPVQPRAQSQLDAPRPEAVPARPNFAMGSQNPADQLREAMKGAARDPGFGAGNLPSRGGLSMHPGAGTGGVEVLSDTQGVDFTSWLQRWHWETEHTWDPLIPDEVNPPILKSGAVVIRFKVLPNGRLMDGSMVLEGRSGDTGLDRAAWGALTGSNYPPLPRAFHGPYLELRAVFLYNMEPR